MGVQLISIEGTKVKMEVTIELSRSMLTSEENIKQAPKRSRMYRYKGSPEISRYRWFSHRRERRIRDANKRRTALAPIPHLMVKSHPSPR